MWYTSTLVCSVMNHFHSMGVARVREDPTFEEKVREEGERKEKERRTSGRGETGPG